MGFCEDRNTLSQKLIEFKRACESLGMRVHEKVGKFIWLTTCIDWIGWEVNTQTMTITMTAQKMDKGMSLCKTFLQLWQERKNP